MFFCWSKIHHPLISVGLFFVEKYNGCPLFDILKIDWVKTSKPNLLFTNGRYSKFVIEFYLELLATDRIANQKNQPLNSAIVIQ